MDIKLIIRAPNQNIEDHVIYCNTDWTVLRIKNHLSVAYPNKPVVEEQKLIYSGRLLHDHLQLKEIIRNEDLESCVHIFHLVWNAKDDIWDPRDDVWDERDDIWDERDDVWNERDDVWTESDDVWDPSDDIWNARDDFVLFDEVSSTSHTLPNESSSFQSAQYTEEIMDTPSENILRQRINSSHSQNNFQMQFQQSHNNLPLYTTDNQAVTQMAAMQQMYAQYLSQYWQSMNAVGLMGNIPLMPVTSHIQTLQNNPGNSIHESPQQPGNERNNIPAVQAEENEFINRDWLDCIFLYFRFLILLCIVYFYTTPERFMLVIIIVVVAFLYHEGWFVRQGIAEAVMGQRNRGQIEINANAGNNVIDRPPSNEDEGQDPHELEAAMDGDNPPHVQNPDVANNNNQVFSPLTFLATFFSSLIPEAPPPVNIN